MSPNAEERGAPSTGYGGAKMGMWLFLFTELLFFGGLFLLYAVYRSEYAEGFHAAAHEENLALGTANTAILITGSLFIALSLSAVRRGMARLSSLLQASTVACGGIFLAIKLWWEWRAKIAAGLYPGSPALDARGSGEALFYGLYFVMTGLHGLHVLIGMGLIGAALFLTARGEIRPGRFVLLENAGLFWHFVDIIWIYLFPLFYLVT